ncbi:hypothetical protein DACRYDRAFT_24450 [Dacryopinax primogenitus]|uniref:Metallo-beta-lactamase domain-containing protein n=1 Tax=Dacryopinax primogenitus (strain DJM 731) TaxID=1858805 RepID=M5FRP1_DACPD|nr:uncharacterized protein DACRYDRAFT_24450 [Dacryopinax primogenitus]EJT98398.1 hypothetical protein DACRYDRAFT_24450 [Dacryopinax primogenitus]
METQAAHVDPLSLPFHPIPGSSSPNAVVKLTLMNCGELTARWIQFRQRGTKEEMQEQETAVVFSWVIEKQLEGKVERWLWDAGLVSDVDRLGPSVAENTRTRFEVHVPPSAQLPELFTHLFPPPATLNTLTGLLISHAHLDHFGALPDFPTSLPVLFGPGTKAWAEGGLEYAYPIPEDFWEHPAWVGEVGEEGARGRGRGWEKLGSYEKAWDWFGDGGLWLAQAPGHCPGHMVALCRVSTSPDTYVLLGGDTCHSRYIYSPFPSPSARWPCACWAYPAEGPEAKPSHTMHEDLSLAYESIARLTRMDMEDNVMSVLAHETEVARELGIGIGQMKGGWEGWKELGWKRRKESGEPPSRKAL